MTFFTGRVGRFVSASALVLIAVISSPKAYPDILTVSSDEGSVSPDTQGQEVKEKKKFSRYIDPAVLDKQLDKKLFRLFTSMDDIARRQADLEKEIQALKASIDELREDISYIRDKPEQKLEMEFR